MPEPVIYTPESTAEALANPPAKRRRAKRTEEERIDYLRADPYVAQFEPYRVLCASCDKWIRLRPNSTYCSIPWDAHRKSCLSKKMYAYVYTLIYYFHTHRPAVTTRMVALSKREIRFWPKTQTSASSTPSASCAILVTVGSPSVLKITCRRSKSGYITGRRVQRVLVNLLDLKRRLLRLSELLHIHFILALNILSRPPKSDANPRHGQHDLGNISAISGCPSDSPVHGKTPMPSATPGSPSSSFKDLTPTNFPAHESRRRNAEQRAATLKADPLIEEVEPNRVFCSLCKKWVQLRQDSSYCAYPWIQHRGKCLARQ